MSHLSESDLQIASLSIHTDDELARTADVSAPINVSTTFRYPSDPAKLFNVHEVEEYDRRSPIYSRISQPVSTRAEAVLDNILDGHAVLYASGLAAFHAAMIHYNPKRVFIGDGYHGCHGALRMLNRNYGVEVLPLDSDPELIQKGDVVHLETPVNPTGISFDISHYADLAHSKGAYLLIDATFAPPPLMKPFDFGADMIMHSATKYFGGHSDLLAGILVTKDPQVKESLQRDRDYTGAITASLESWLLLRSLRTYSLRIKGHYTSANAIVKYLHHNISKLSKLTKVYHSSLQTEEFVKTQLPLGGPPTFSIEVIDKETARRLPSKLKLFNHATSLGGVESLIEWRSMSDDKVSEALLRVSVGLEDTQDLINDLTRALE